MKQAKIMVMVFMALMIVASPALAFSGDGSGSIGDPYIITTPAQFNEMHLNLSAYYELGNDIDMAGFTNFTEPIGYWSDPFVGSFDGKGFTVSNFHWSYNDPNYDHPAGVFGNVYYTSGDETTNWIRNVNFNNYSYTTTDTYDDTCCIGSLIGGSDSTADWDFSNIHFTNSYLDVRYTSEWGGVAGYTGKAGMTINNISYQGTLYGGGRYGGGIIGNAAQNQVLTNMNFVGEMILNQSGTTGNTYGGIVGTGRGIQINNSYVVANFTATNGCPEASAPEDCEYGGILGTAAAVSLAGPVNISNSYFKGTLPTPTSGGVGGTLVARPIVGTIGYSGTLGECNIFTSYYGSEDGNTFNTTDCNMAAIGLTDEQFGLTESFSGFDFTNTWTGSSPGPIFVWQVEEEEAAPTSSGSSGSGTSYAVDADGNVVGVYQNGQLVGEDPVAEQKGSFLSLTGGDSFDIKSWWNDLWATIKGWFVQ